MKRMIPIGATALALLATPLLAQGALDADGNGTLSFDELRAGYPSLTEEQFAGIDANGDGAVDTEEFNAAQEEGTLPR